MLTPPMKLGLILTFWVGIISDFHPFSTPECGIFPLRNVRIRPVYSGVARIVENVDQCCAMLLFHTFLRVMPVTMEIMPRVGTGISRFDKNILRLMTERGP